jgi:hypothetical protein
MNRQNAYQRLMPLSFRAVARILPASVVRLAVLSAALLPGLARADQFMKPTAEELAMTSLPGYPGAAAVMLYKEEITRDDLHVVQHYERVKVLSEEGKKYANIVLGYVTTKSEGDMASDEKSLGDIAGRTVHPDGTVVPFTGKPYLKVIADAKYGKFQQKIFTLPDVTVGSIIEYRYNTRTNDMIFESPMWLVQDELYLREGHFVWYPTSHLMNDENGDMVTTISWLPILPKGASVVRTDVPGSGQMFELKIKNVEPLENEEFMPPLGSYSYRVRFAYTPYRTGEGHREKVVQTRRQLHVSRQHHQGKGCRAHRRCYHRS